MSRAERTSQGLFSGALLALAGVIVSLWPYTSVVMAGLWTTLTMTVVLAVIAVSLLCRRLVRGRRRPLQSLVTLVGQIVVLVGAVTVLTLPQTALFGIVPTPASFGLFVRLMQQAGDEVYNGVAPLSDTAGLRAAIAAGFGVVAILFEHFVARDRALPAIVLATAIGAVPMIITFGDANVVWFVLLAVLVLFLLRRAARGTDAAARRGSGLTALGAGTVAILVAMIVTPGLPLSSTWFNAGSGITVDASLRLGDDLRRPNPVTVLTIATSQKTAPYLRMATLTRFDGEVWRPDRADSQSLTEGFGDPDWDDEVEGLNVQTSIKVVGMSSDRVPVPYPARTITGLGTDWKAVPDDRTVVSTTADASGRDYTVTSATVQPTLEQITAASAAQRGESDRLPDDLPPIIAETAREVTAGAGSDYERLIALQEWFRGQFSYSVDTPVDDGFDGTGAEAVATFLEVRTGYCIHFAGAFSLMARSLDMPVRIVVGYLPGTLTDDRRGDDYIYTVDSDQLHAWPEVHFDDIGWVPFEPTATLGVPTAFSPAEVDDEEGGGETDTPSAEPTAAPSAGPSVAPEDEQFPEAGTGGELQRLDPTPILLTVLGILVVVLLPLLIRTTIRMLRMRRAAHGDAAAAWSELRDTLTDLGVAPSAAQSPRERAAWLASSKSVDAQSMRPLVAAIERASYARSSNASDDLAGPLRDVLRDVRAASDARARLGALFLPRSLVMTRRRD